MLSCSDLYLIHTIVVDDINYKIIYANIFMIFIFYKNLLSAYYIPNVYKALSIQ